MTVYSSFYYHIENFLLLITVIYDKLNYLYHVFGNLIYLAYNQCIGKYIN